MTGPVYRVLQNEVTLAGLGQFLALARSEGREITVKVSYTNETLWEDVVAVYNECHKAKIQRCSLIPLHTPQAGRLVMPSS